MTLTFKPRALPEEAQQWGREVETRVKSLDKGVTRFSDNLQNMDRAVGGGLAVQARQVAELATRRQVPVNTFDILRTVNVPANSSASSSGQLSYTVYTPDGKTRRALMYLSGNFYAVSNLFVFSSIGMQVTGGGVTARRSGFAPVATSAPADWAETFSIVTPVVVPGSDAFVISFNATSNSIAASTQSITLGLSDMVMNFVFAEEV